MASHILPLIPNESKLKKKNHEVLVLFYAIVKGICFGGGGGGDDTL